MLLLSKFTISGHSMVPTYKSGDTILASSLPFLFSKPKIRDIIVFKKDSKILIKRITKVTEQGFLVEGDNKGDSMDSAVLGIILPKHILGKVILKL